MPRPLMRAWTSFTTCWRLTKYVGPSISVIHSVPSIDVWILKMFQKSFKSFNVTAAQSTFVQHLHNLIRFVFITN